MIYRSETVRTCHFKYGSSRYFTTLITFLPDGTRFEWSCNEDGIVFFRWAEDKKICLYNLLSKMELDYSVREDFGIKTDYNIYDSGSDIQAAYDLLIAKKQFIEPAFSQYLFEGLNMQPSNDKKSLKVNWRGNTIDFRYGIDKILGYYENSNGDLLNPLLGLLIAKYLMGLKPEECEVDGEVELSWTARSLISNAPATLLFSQYKSLSNELLVALSQSNCQSLYLNNLQELSAESARLLSQSKGRLFLDGLRSVNEDALKILLGHKGRYLSLRGLSLENEEISRLSKEYDGFLRLGKKAVAKKKETYTDEELAGSIVSDKKQLSAIIKLLTADNKEQIDSGLLMFSSLNDAPVADAILEGIEYFNDVNSGVLVLNNRFKTTIARQPLLNYALLGVIYHSPADSRAANRLREQVTYLQIDLSDLTYLGAFPELKTLELTNSQKDLVTLNGIGECSRLEELRISGCGSVSNIEDLANLPLTNFRFQDCFNIASLAPLQGKADGSGTKELDLQKFTELTTLDGIEFFQDLETLYLNENSNLVSAAALLKLPNLKNLAPDSRHFGFTIRLSSCVGMEGLLIPAATKASFEIGSWGINIDRTYPNIKELSVSCRGMDSLEWLVAFPALEELSINCPDLSDLSALKDATQLKKLTLRQIKTIDFSPLGTLKSLDYLYVQNVLGLKDLDVLRNMPALQKADFFSCDNLEDISGWVEKDFFESKTDTLGFFGLPAIREIGDVSHLGHIQKAFLRRSCCSDLLQQFRKFSNMRSVRVEQGDIHISVPGDLFNFDIELIKTNTLSLSGDAIHCLRLTDTSITDLSGLAGLNRLEKLFISDAKNLSSLKGLELLKGLKVLSVEKAPMLESIANISSHIHLSELTINGSLKLKDTNVLAGLSELKKINLRDCINLSVKPQAYDMNAEQTLRYQQKLLKAMGVAPKEELTVKQEKIREKQKGTVDKKAFSSIKKMLQSRELDQIDTALQMISSINEPELYDLLLEGTTVNGEGKLVRNKIFDGTGPAQPYLDYGLLHILKFASEFDHWKDLCGSLLDWTNELARQAPMEQFSRLNNLYLRGFKDLELPLGLAELKKLNIYCKLLDSTLIEGCPAVEKLVLQADRIVGDLKGLKPMCDLRELEITFQDADITGLMNISGSVLLERLSISGPYSQTYPMKSLKGLEPLKALQHLRLNHISFADTVALKAVTSLQSIDFSDNRVLTQLYLPDPALQLITLKLYKMNFLKRIELSQLPEEGLELKLESVGLEELPELKGVRRLKSIKLNDLPHLKNLNALSALEAITEQNDISREKNSLKLNGCTALEDISGLEKLGIEMLQFSQEKLPHSGPLPLLRKIRSDTLQSLEGLSRYPALEVLNLRGDQKIKDLSFLKEAPGLEYLSVRDCFELTSLEGLQHCKKLKVLNLADTTKLSDIAVLQDMMIEHIYIAGSLLKKSDYPAQLQDFIDWQTKPE